MQIIVDDLTGPEIAEFLTAHVAELRAISPPESTHALDLDALRRPEITFWSMRDGDAVVACGALKELDDEHAELKSMRVAPTHQNRGLASRLLEHITATAQQRGFSRLSLETGSFDFFEPARRLYAKHGFTRCEPFADYRPDPNSVFLTKRL
ncbi:GNAT family N-acetyltransferase [Saccharopolyspora indica]|uniref:GNAT family N-acetyltransferase n=1 Tax=Saccharopolyspora indica TaxID=1229659 RepID=UPI0022EA1AB8|nr:GNAT family N-acetyltransferase [Saccharopolyspora indica]MDA3648532.1 GNAT family N-acetyltransferase [Saccharopolyspora indica]